MFSISSTASMEYVEVIFNLFNRTLWMACVRACKEVARMVLRYRVDIQKIFLFGVKLLSVRLRTFRASCMDACKKL